MSKRRRFPKLLRIFIVRLSLVSSDLLHGTGKTAERARTQRCPMHDTGDKSNASHNNHHAALADTDPSGVAAGRWPGAGSCLGLCDLRAVAMRNRAVDGPDEWPRPQAERRAARCASMVVAGNVCGPWAGFCGNDLGNAGKSISRSPLA